MPFTPPLCWTTAAHAQGPEGHVSSRTLLLTDASDQWFSLHLETDAHFIAGLYEWGDVGDDRYPVPDGYEPVFVVPALSIDDEVLELILGGVPPALLDLYLVPQVSPDD